MTNQPQEVIRDGALKAVIWANNGFNTVSVLRSFKDKDGNWQERPTFSANELPRLVALLQRAHEVLKTSAGSPPSEGPADEQ